MAEEKRIAKNTLFLYSRMLFVMGVSLFTSRINLRALGVEDYGLFNIVAGIIGLVSFLNSALGTSSSRFITISLGKDDLQQSRILLSTIYGVHLILGVIVLLTAELIGIYMVNNILNIPTNRLIACNVIFQCSCIVMFINLLNIPMTASIIAHEKFNLFAYIGIYEVVMKLLSSYILFIWPYDKLILWGILNLSITLSLWIFYYIYCRKCFAECRFLKGFDRYRAKQVSSFSFWNLLGSLAIALKNSGVNIVLNIFWGPLINAANAIAYQVNNAIMSFSSNFTTAINPQIFKTFAQEKYKETEALVHLGGKLSFLLVSILGLPLVVEMKLVLDIWLNEYPDYTIIFCRLIIILSWIECFNYSIGTAIQANGKIKTYQIFVSGLSLFNLPLSYLVFKFNAPPTFALFISIGISTITLIVRIFFIKKLLNFSVSSYLKNVIMPSILMIIMALPACIVLHCIMSASFIRLFIVGIMSAICNFCVFYLFMGELYKAKVKAAILRRFKQSK